MSEQKLYGSSLIKAKQILDYMITTEEAPELKEISANTGIGKPTALKLLNTMVSLGLMRKMGDEKKYYLGTDFIAYAEKASSDFNLLQYAKPALTKLRDATDETINLGVEGNNSVVLLAKMESKNRSIKLKSQVGGKMNLYSSSMGKAMLATWTSEQLQHYIHETEFRHVGPNTITSPDDLLKEVDKTKQRGFSVDNEENEPEVFCLGFSLCKNGKLVGAFSITAPKYRMTEKNREKYLVLAKQTQQEIEKAL
ncbi:IclR family transcriptional regulator [Secundilactobacillus kimchicus]|uniref:Transcriptional regulator n=1 Tax=Secundilactobacillus kimchicus JCM 15530 TaxID=1302272 RepID=A0A0R1HPM6_9LACO|nr:IclR family transcriptional regulator [Secundilactobacillus kimchicus]KRK48383.1 transcriptional regulator [Secundilactobacillus kimchicus JCM 15530]